MADVEPLITVIIPTFRRPELLRRAILSVVSQTFPAYQVCVYDNASGDDTQKVVAELATTDSRINYHCHDENIGMAANFNFGLQEVNTPFFSFLSDDDVLLPNFFESALQSLQSNAKVMFYVGSTIMVEDGKITHIAKELGRFGYFPPPDGLLEIVNTDGLIWTSIVFRSEVIGRRVGTLDTKACNASDIDFVLRIAAHHAIIISDKPGAILEHHGQSLSTTTSDFRLILLGFQHLSNKIMSDDSLPLDVRVHVKKKLNQWLCYQLGELGGRALDKGESDNVHAIAELLARMCNYKTKPTVLVCFSRLRELSELACRLVSLIRRLFIFCASFSTVLANKMRYRQLQKQYARYLQYIQ